MNDTPTPPNPKPEELEFSVTFTNGAAKRLKGLMDHFNKDSAKDTISLSLDFLDAIKDSEQILVRKKDGSMRQLIISPDDKKI